MPAKSALQRGGPVRALCVLVVEDDPQIGALVAETLEVMGYEVQAVESTEAGAVAAAARSRPDLMVVDVLLDEGNGVSAVESIIRTAGHIPHIFVSGDLLQTRTFKPGAVVIQKPYREADLAAAIGRALGVEALA
jgi:CheY-like chemotaxis protein